MPASATAPPLRLTAGFGCQSGCPVEVLRSLLDRTLLAHGLDQRALVGIASLDRKAQEPGLLQLARELELPLHTFDTATLNRHAEQLSHRSPLAYRHTGCHGVAESSALALSEHLGAPCPALWVTRQVQGAATLALARATDSAHPLS